MSDDECRQCKESAQDIFEANMESMPFAGDFNALYDELRAECEHEPLPVTVSPFEPDPRNGGTGPHVVEHVASGERALCGGPGFCAVCDR